MEETKSTKRVKAIIMTETATITTTKVSITTMGTATTTKAIREAIEIGTTIGIPLLPRFTLSGRDRGTRTQH